jgi:cardiolipin synthase
VLLLGLVVGLAGCTPAPPTTPSDFTLVQYPDAGFSGMYYQTAAATKSIDMELYELADSREVAELIAAHRRGVAVRVLLNSAFNGRSVNGPAASRLVSNGVPVRYATSSTIFHIKTTTFDGTTSDISSANLTPQFYSTTRDAEIVDTYAPQVNAIEQTFDHDWDGQTAADDEVQAPGLIWSPDSESTVVSRIASAKSSIDFTSEEFSDTYVYRALAQAAARGVRCRIVMTDSPNWAKAFAAVTAAGCRVHVLPVSATGLYIHEKELLIDARTSSASVVLGSQNATYSSLAFNRELSISLTAVEAPAVLSAVTRTFDLDFASAKEWRP